MVSRNPNSETVYYFRVIYCQFDPETLFVSFNETYVNLGSYVPTLAILQLIDNSFYCVLNLTSEMSVTTTRYPIYGEFSREHAIYTLYSFKSKLQTMSCQLAVSMMGEKEPYLSVDISVYKNFFEQTGGIHYFIRSKYSKTIRCEYGNTTLYKNETDKNEFYFNFTKDDFEELPTMTFSAVCNDDVNGVACGILYPAPNKTGFHLIRYPDRDGISITGRGFLSEIIPVEAGKSFIYYKTYPEAIKLMREYSYDDPEIKTVKVKIEDKRTAEIETFKRSRKICLFDGKDQIVPFSRKCVEKDIDSFLIMIGVTTDVDFNYFINDENGCIVFEPKYISSNDLKVQKQACDLFSINDTEIISNVDKSEMIFEPGGKDPQQRKRMILILCGAILIILAIIAIIVTLCIIKRRRKKLNEQRSVLLVSPNDL